MVDSGGLLSRCTGSHPVPRVRIPPSPPSVRTQSRIAASRRLVVTCATLLLVAFAASGCVERLLRIDSDPAGATIYLDGRNMGQAPVEVPFTFYGTRRIDAWSADRPGATQFVELEPPWYQWFPLDLFSELLDPVTHVDRHEVTIAVPATLAAPRDDVVKRAEELRRESR